MKWSLFFLAALAAAADSDPAMMPPPVSLNPGPEYAAGTRRFQGIPGIERASGGRLWAAWYAGGPGEGPENYVVLVTSGDDGRTWSEPRLVIDPPGFVRAFDPCLWIDPAGAMWLSWAQGAGKFDGRSGVWAIRTRNPNDPNPAWSAPRRLSHGVMMNKPAVLRSGEWLFSAAWWNVAPDMERVNEEYKLGLSPGRIQSLSHDLGGEKGSNLLLTSDRGRTFRFIRGPSVPGSTFDEHMLVEGRDGAWTVFVRTRYGIGSSTSRDRGKTWTGGADTGIRHANARFFIRRLRSGSLLLVRHNAPQGMARSHLTAEISRDDGRTWSGGLLLDERTAVSYPDGVQAPDGRIYVIYDRERQRDMEILFAVFREEDVLDGACKSAGCRLRQIVNRAGQDTKK